MKRPPPRYPEWLLAPLLLIPVALLQVAALNRFCALGKARVNLAWRLDAEIALLMVSHAWPSCPDASRALRFSSPTMPSPTMSSAVERITVNPAQCGGRPCIRGMRIRVTDVLDLLAAGLSADQVIEELPDLEREDIAAVLQYASRRLNHAYLAA